MKPCDRCGVQIIFAQSRSTGKWMPVDDEASELGNVRLDLEASPITATVLAGDNLANARAAGERLHLSHFVTCPHAQEFRRR